MKSLPIAAPIVALAALPWLSTAAVELELDVTATASISESDWTEVYYSDSPLLLGNDGGTSTGGFHAFDLNGDTPLPVVKSVVNGRTSILTTVYGVADKDWVLTIATADSVLRAFQLPKLVEDEEAHFWALGDWSSLCSWRSETGNQYVFLFGKEEAIQFFVRAQDDSLELVKVQSFAMPWEVTGCSASDATNRMYLSSAVDETNVHYFPLAESTDAPEISSLGETSDSITGLAIYISKDNSEYIFVSHEDAIGVYAENFELLGTLKLTGLADIEIEGLSIYQAETPKYPAGAITYAFEADDDAAGFGISSLESVAEELGLVLNTEYDPDSEDDDSDDNPICEECSDNGYCGPGSTCSCFAGFVGDDCADIECTDNCSGHGECVGPEQCECESGWGGLRCSFLVVEPELETDEHGRDGDDPAIWIAPEAENSRVITTTKSTEGAGLVVFDLEGKFLQHMAAGEPNNVDVIYGFPLGDREVDLAFAACRADDTLCLFEMTPNGTLVEIPGGVQPVEADYTVYGSCTYRSPTSGKQYLFVNEKSARYLQYELTSSENGTLETTLVRDFTGGSGGQVEGCVADEQNGWLFLGEEPSALWRYNAEPDGGDEGTRIAHVGDGNMHADVEGVTLVMGDTKDKGFIIVSTQGVRAFNIYRRAEPHEYAATFTIGKSSGGNVDAVTNTDGVAAVGTALGPKFPLGLVVAHDDSNELSSGGTSDESSFKFVSLESIIGAEGLAGLDLLSEVDSSWDPRSSA